MILKTYARIFSDDAEKTLALLQPLHAGQPHLRFRFNDWDLIGIGDILIVGGTDESIAPIRGSIGPLIVDDLDETLTLLETAGAEITQRPVDVPTGRMLYARHPDGSIVEYVQWTSELVERFIRTPQREGKLASQL